MPRPGLHEVDPAFIRNSLSQTGPSYYILGSDLVQPKMTRRVPTRVRLPFQKTNAFGVAANQLRTIWTREGGREGGRTADGVVVTTRTLAE